jgi:hypothetical protein
VFAAAVPLEVFLLLPATVSRSPMSPRFFLKGPALPEHFSYGSFVTSSSWNYTSLTLGVSQNLKLVIGFDFSVL